MRIQTQFSDWLLCSRLSFLIHARLESAFLEMRDSSTMGHRRMNKQAAALALVDGFPAYPANPSFATLLNDLNIRITGVCKDFAMFVDAQERHACPSSIFFGKPGGRRVCSFIDFRDDDEFTAGLKDPKDFAHVCGQVGPPEVCFHGRDEIEDVV